MFKAAKVMAKLILEHQNPPTPEEMSCLKNKFQLWQKLHPDEFNCRHCIFNHYDCAGANKYYNEGCMGFLREGNYVK